MKKLIFEMRMGVFVWFVLQATRFVPPEATETLLWLTRMPLQK